MTQSEKMRGRPSGDFIDCRTVPLSVKTTLRELGINQSTFYQWYKRYLTDGFADPAYCRTSP